MRDQSLWPEGEDLRNAIRWIGAQGPPHDVQQIAEASRRFDLSPADEAFLLRLFLEETGEGG